MSLEKDKPLNKNNTTNPVNSSLNPTRLLFFDNFTYSNPQYNVEEIFFKQAVNIQQFRILKQESNPHANFKSMQSITQKDIIYNFEIFGRNLKKIDDKFELIFKNENINKTNGETDNIFPLLTEFTTNHIVIRGKFEKITMCIYGTLCDRNENYHYLEKAKQDVPLEKLDEKIQLKKSTEVKKSEHLSKEDQLLIEKFPIDVLLGDDLNLNVSKKNEEKSISDDENVDMLAPECLTETFKEIKNINKGNKELTDKIKTGYIYYAKDLIQIIDNLLKLYSPTYSSMSLDENNNNNNEQNKENSNNNTITDKEIFEHQMNYKNLFIILEILINRNKAHLEDDCVFNKSNLEIFSLIPKDIVKIITFSIKGKKYGETEIKYGLKLLKFLSNDEKFVNEFIQNDGMEELYRIIFISNDYFYNNHNKDQNMTQNDAKQGTQQGQKNNEGNNVRNDIMNSSILKALALENLYKIITFNSAYEKLLQENIDKKKFPIKDFMVKESVKEKINQENNLKPELKDEDKDKSGSKSKDRERDREKDRDKESSGRGSHHHGKKKSSKSRSHSKSSSSSSSYSRYRSRSKSFNRSDSSSPSRPHKREIRQNVQLNNGVQILSTLLISKKNILLSNIIKNITKKINLIQYLKNIKELINSYLHSDFKKEVDLIKICYHFDRILSLIQKLDTAYQLKDKEKLINTTNKINNNTNPETVGNACAIKEENENNNIFPNQENGIGMIEPDYPYKHNWIDYFDMNKKFYNKEISDISKNNNNSSSIYNLEQTNTEYMIKNSSTKYDPHSNNIIITNEIALLFEQYNFFENVILLLSCPNIQSSFNNFYSLSLKIKNFISILCLNIGGGNLLSKNFSSTSLLLITLEKLVSEAKKHFSDYELKKISILGGGVFSGNKGKKNEIINNKFSELVIPTQKINEDNISDELFIQINLLQSYYLLNYVNDFIHLFDDLGYLLENVGKNLDLDEFNFRQKAFEILISLYKKSTFCQLGNQAFLSLLNNKYIIQIFFRLIEFIIDSNEEILDYEAHISLIIQFFFMILSSNNYHTTIFLLQNKKVIKYFRIMHNVINNVIDKKDIEPIDNKLIDNLNGLINSLKDLDNTSLLDLMTNLHETIYSNISKYNLTEKAKVNDEKFQRYNEEYKLLVKKFSNDDMNFLGTIYKKGSLINEVLLSIKLLNINFRINPLLLIESENKHLHSILKYLIINSVNSLNFLLKKQMYKKEEGGFNLEIFNMYIENCNNTLLMNSNNNNNNQTVNKNPSTISDDNGNIILLSNLLYYLFDILCCLLNNLLTCHVDHYRDNDVIDELLLCITSCFKFLFSFYSIDEKILKIGPFLYEKIYTVQNLFNKCLDVLHELCQFNTTIKLKFKDIIQKSLTIPEDIPCKLFIINYILNNNNNEFTIDHFIDAFKDEVDKVYPSIDYGGSLGQTGQNISISSSNINYEDTLMMEQLENIKIDTVNLKLILTHQGNPNIKNFIDYIIFMGMTSNNDFIINQCAFIILNIFHKFSLTNNTETFEKMTIKIISELKTKYEIISKINCSYFEIKDYDIYIPKIRNLLNSLKFVTILISSDVKFQFTFLEVTAKYLNIFKYIKNYIFNKINTSNSNNENANKENSSNNNINMSQKIKEERLCDMIFDIALITLEGFKTLFNNKENFEERYYFTNNLRYDLVEELPHMKDISEIIKELNSFLFIIKSINSTKETQNNINNKTFLLINKIFEIFLNLSTNFYGQNILLENIELSEFINGLKELKEKEQDNSNINKPFMNKYLTISIRSLIKLSLVLFFDLNYYENKKQPDADDENSNKFIISSIRLKKLAKLVGGTSPNSENENVEENIQLLYQYNKFLIESLNQDQNNDTTFIRIDGLQTILKDYKSTMVVLDLPANTPTLPGMRKIKDKFQFMHVYNYFRQIQGIDNEARLEINSKGEVKNINFNNVISILNGNANSNNNYNQMTSNNSNEIYNRNQINEFDKLLGWKKARIYANEYDTLKTRETNFNIDTYISNSGESFVEYEFKFYQLKKKYIYISKDSFEHYCNSIQYGIYIINQFKNLSAFIYNTLNTKHYLFDSNEHYMKEIMELFFHSNQNDFVQKEEITKLEKEITNNNNLLLNINEAPGSNNKIKKKTKSKINLFIYKQKFERQQATNAPQIRLMYNPMMKQEMARYSNKVSGRNLSAHVDNLNPEKKVVSVTYNTYNNNNNNQNNMLNNPNSINQQGMVNNPTQGNLPSSPKNNSGYAMMVNSGIPGGQMTMIPNKKDMQIDNNSNKNLINSTQNINNITMSLNNANNTLNTMNSGTIGNNNMMIGINSPSIQKNNRVGGINNNNILLNNLNTMKQNSQNELTRQNSTQSNQMLMMSSNQMQPMGPERNPQMSMNPINQISNNPPSLPNEMNPNNINQMNPTNNMNNLIPTMNNLNPVNQGVQSISPQVQPQIINSPSNNNLNMMNFLAMNNMQNPLMNLQGINQMIGSPQNYPNIHGQMTSMQNLPNMNNNMQSPMGGQFSQQFNQNLIGMNQPPQSGLVPPNQNQQNTPQLLLGNKQESGQNKPNNIQQNDKLMSLMGTIQGLLQGTETKTGDPRKKRK